MTSLMKLTAAVPLAASEAGKLTLTSKANIGHSHEGITALARMMGVLKATLKVIRQQRDLLAFSIQNRTESFTPPLSRKRLT